MVNVTFSTQLYIGVEGAKPISILAHGTISGLKGNQSLSSHITAARNLHKELQSGRLTQGSRRLISRFNPSNIVEGRVLPGTMSHRTRNDFSLCKA